MLVKPHSPVNGIRCESNSRKCCGKTQKRMGSPVLGRVSGGEDIEMVHIGHANGEEC